MKVDGIALLQMIKDGKIKDKTIIKPTNSDWELQISINGNNDNFEIWNNNEICTMNNINFLSQCFEIIEEPKEEPKEELEEIELIDIHYVDDKCIFKVNGQSIDETIAIKVNELIENQNKIIRELKANKENE